MSGKKSNKMLNKLLMPLLFMGAAGSINAADISNAGILTYSDTESSAAVVAEAQDWYKSNGFTISEDVVDDYVNNLESGLDLNKLPNLMRYRGINSTEADSTQSANLEQEVTPIESNSAPITNASTSVTPSATSTAKIQGSEFGYMIPQGRNDGGIDMIVLPHDNAGSGVLTRKFEQDGETLLETYKSILGQPGVAPLDSTVNYALSTLNNVGSDEIKIGDINHYVFSFTQDELKSLGLSNSELTVVEYSNNRAERGSQDSGKAANEVEGRHNKFFFSYNATDNQVIIQNGTDSDAQTLVLNLNNTVQEVTPVEKTETTVTNTPTVFGENVTFDYDTTGKFLLAGLGISDADGIDLSSRPNPINVELIQDGTTNASLGNYILRDIKTGDNGQIVSGTIKGNGLENLAEDIYVFTVMVKDKLGKLSTQSYTHSLSEQNAERLYDGITAIASKDGSNLALEGIISDKDGFIAGNCYLQIQRDDEFIEGINPTGIEKQSYELGDLIKDGSIDLSGLEFAFPEGFEFQKGDKVVVYTKDKFDSSSVSHEVDVKFGRSTPASSAYGFDYNQDGLTILLGTDLAFGEKDVLSGLYPGQVSTSNDTPETSLSGKVLYKGAINDEDLARFSAGIAFNALLGADNTEGLSATDDMDVSNYLRNSADVLVELGYNPKVLDGILELYVGGLFNYKNSSIDMNRSYDFVFNEGASSIPMTDQLSQEESMTGFGAEAAIKVNPNDNLSFGANLEMLSYSGRGEGSIASQAAFNSQDSTYTIDGATTRLTAQVAGYIPKLAELHDLVLAGYAGYEWNSIQRVSGETSEVLAGQEGNGFVAGGLAKYTFNDTVSGFVGADYKNAGDNGDFNLTLGISLNPLNIGKKE